MKFNKGITKRAAYAGIAILVLSLPVSVLDTFNSHHSLNTFGKICLLILFVILIISAICLNLGFIQLAKKHNEKFLLVITYLLLGFTVLTTVLNVLHVLDPASSGIVLVRRITEAIEMIVVFFNGFAIARLYPYYGKITLAIRNSFVIVAIGFFLVEINLLSRSQNLLFGVAAVLLGVAAVIALVRVSVLSIKMLLRADD